MTTAIPQDIHAEGQAAVHAISRTALTFRLSGETFAIEVERVQEVIDPLPMTRVPRSDPFVPCLINVRGAIVPVLDVHHRLGMQAPPADVSSRLVVVEIPIDGENTKVALMVDEVSEVVQLDLSSVQDIPALGARWPGEVIRGLVLRGDDLIVLLNSETLFSPPTRVENALNAKGK